MRCVLVDFESCWQLDARWMEGYCGDVMKNGGTGVMVGGEKM